MTLREGYTFEEAVKSQDVSKKQISQLLAKAQGGGQV